MNLSIHMNASLFVVFLFCLPFLFFCCCVFVSLMSLMCELCELLAVAERKELLTQDSVIISLFILTTLRRADLYLSINICLVKWQNSKYSSVHPLQSVSFSSSPSVHHNQCINFRASTSNHHHQFIIRLVATTKRPQFQNGKSSYFLHPHWQSPMTAVVEDSCAVVIKKRSGWWRWFRWLTDTSAHAIVLLQQCACRLFLSDKSCFHAWFVAFNAL